jgi:predicted XRE-type DNA-binding protein
MTDDDEFELIRGSGNVFADLGMPDADMRQLRAGLAAEVIKALDLEGLSTRAAEKITGTAAADFSRIRNAKLTGFTADRLMTILHKLNRDVQVTVTRAA